MKHPAVILAVALLLISSAFICYRIIWLRYPLFPPTPEKAWQLYMEARLKPDGKEITVMIALPYSHAGQMIVEEQVASGSLTFNLFRDGPNQVGIWSGIVGPGEEIVTYRATILMAPQRSSKTPAPILGSYPIAVGEAEQALAKRLVAKWRDLAPLARFQAIAATARGLWGVHPPPDQDIKAWTGVQEKHGRLTALLVLFRAADLPAQTVEGLLLTESIVTKPIAWVEVWTGQRWEKLHPENGEIYRKPASLLPLTIGELPTVRVSQGELPEIRWTLTQQIISQWRMHFERIKRSDRLLDQWSLFRLPPEFQGTFRILILVPIGALMICVLRNFVGFPTFGIFMPVLMALAFRNTGVVHGLGIFAGVLLIGYAVRHALDRLRLLLVPRLSVLLTLVIASFIVLALIGNELGWREFMAVGLLPFVILTMTIERFFVITEEAGAPEALRTAAGSAAVAAITYGIIQLEPLQLTFFVYPELLFTVAALQVLLGRYTGYRLSEFIRFRKLRDGL